MTTDAAQTRVLQAMLTELDDRAVVDDLLFLEAWERAPQLGPGTALRIGQLRRANPELAAAIRAELAAQKSRAL